MTVTIVTVIKDDLNGFLKTYNSVEPGLSQNLYSYIVVDSSIDNSIDIYCRNKANTTYIHIPPNGIFNAMNEAVKYIDPNAYVYFLNSGDTLLPGFYSFLDNMLHKQNFDVIYGNLEISGRNEVPLPLEFLKLGELPFSHQSVFTKSKLVYFDERLRNVADMDLFLKLYIKDASFMYFNETPARVAEMNCSKNRFLQWRETYTVLLKNRKFLSIIFRFFLSVFHKKIFSPNMYY